MQESPTSTRRLLIVTLVPAVGFVLLVLASPLMLGFYLEYGSCYPANLVQVAGTKWTATVKKLRCPDAPVQTQIDLNTIRKGEMFYSTPILVIQGVHRIKPVWLDDKTLEILVPKNEKIYTRQTRFEDVSIVYK